jgi:HYR domain
MFKLGRTTVRCNATDANGNTSKASFRVTVKRA